VLERHGAGGDKTATTSGRRTQSAHPNRIEYAVIDREKFRRVDGGNRLFAVAFGGGFTMVCAKAADSSAERQGSRRFATGLDRQKIRCLIAVDVQSGHYFQALAQVLYQAVLDPELAPGRIALGLQFVAGLFKCLDLAGKLLH
jgi:hypothetical protein